MTNERDQGQESARHGGMPGDGAGRRDETGHTGVHPASAGWPADDMEIRREGEWGQGERGVEGYDDSGASELRPEVNAPDAPDEEQRR